MKKIHKLIYLFLLLCVFSTTTAEPVSNAQVSALNGSLINTLKDGGYVLYLRHTATDHDKYGVIPVDLTSCEKQRPLSNLGRQQAVLMGKAFTNLNIPVGDIFSSPLCRTKDTAILAFKYVTIKSFLASTANMKKQDREYAVNKLKFLLESPPKEGTNSVIVGHSANIREATGDWPKPEGTMLVYKLLENKPKLIARIPPEDWMDFVNE
jgi:phosphohistidine phosphatase SixA